MNFGAAHLVAPPELLAFRQTLRGDQAATKRFYLVWYFSYWSGVPEPGLSVIVRDRTAVFAFPTNDDHGDRGFLVPDGRADLLGDAGVAPVGADHDPRALALDPGDAIAVEGQAAHRMRLAVLRSRLDGGLDEERVERVAPWTDAHRDAAGFELGPGEREVAHVRGELRDPRAAGGQNPVQ